MSYQPDQLDLPTGATDTSGPLAEANKRYRLALGLDRPAEVIAQTQQVMRDLEGITGPQADRLRLALLDLEIQIQCSETYMPPPADALAQFVVLASQSGDTIHQARALHYQGITTWATQSFADGLVAMRQAVDRLAACGDLEGQFSAIGSFGLFVSVTGNLEGGIALLRQGVELFDKLTPEQRALPVHQATRARLMLRLGLNLYDLDYFDEALHWLGEARQVYEKTGRLYGCTTEYAQLYARVGWWEEAEKWARHGMEAGPTESDRAYAQTLYGFVLGQQGRIAEGIAQLEQALEVVSRINVEVWQPALANVFLGELLLADGPTRDLARAEAHSDAGFAIGEASLVHYGSIYGLINKTRIALDAGDTGRAVALALDAARRVRERGTLTLVREEEILYWEFRALQADGKDGHYALAEAYQRLQLAASRIGDAAMRESFLRGVPIHRTIIDANDAYEKPPQTGD